MYQTEEPLHSNPKHISTAFFLSLAYHSLGVIYGDIGTSPLYVLKTIFTERPNENDVIGGVSLVVYAIIVLVTVKYVMFILTADNNGEGGPFALVSLIKKGSIGDKWKTAFTMLSLCGAAFVIADGALTPAISILSAIEGLKTIDSSLQPAVIPISLFILIIIFMCQKFGTSKVGIAFSPVMAVWFSTLAVIGIYHVIRTPKILIALNPAEGVLFLARTGGSGFLKLGGVFLAVTGLEALYADLGHFSKNSIRLAWCGFVMPALVLNYLGQGALLIDDPSKIVDPFYKSVSSSLYWPLLVLATLATVTGSQAMITGCFSLISHAISLNFAPPLPVTHTSTKVFGQVYIAPVNYLLLVLVVIIVLLFQSSSEIGNAYGITVCFVMNLTTILFCAVMKYTWNFAWWKVIPFALIFIPIDMVFLASNLVKFVDGGWFSIVIGFIITAVMVCWFVGERKLEAQAQLPVMNIKQLKELISSIHSTKNDNGAINLSTFSGMGVFFSTSEKKTPLVFNHIINRMHVIAELNVFLTIIVAPTPKVLNETKITVKSYGNNIFRIIAKYGYSEAPIDALDIIKQAAVIGLPVTQQSPIAFFIDRQFIQVTNQAIVKRAVLNFYALLKRVFGGISKSIVIPENSVVTIGTVTKL